ncbi:hypothetical protein BCR42DRAFT_425268 [Absidia repens]|uniref:DUF3835 domain-containing protein n=1 Tax=Absidia repens TaxID=90262 RepID=A0A1X2I2M1_9FUNG|nr:hypothetical protein BCR42DRAFT_425268 [Absidia repens]
MTSQHALTELNQKFTQWSSRIEQNKQELEEELNRWQGYKEDYDALGKQLETLADETTRPAMIPFGSLAFMPGKLIHTNEITVYLGDQYYVERSVKQALGILNRRKQGVNENLGLVQAQWNAIEAKSSTTSSNKNLFPSAEGVNEDGLPIMEIREEIPDDEPVTASSSSSSSSSAPQPAPAPAPAPASVPIPEPAAPVAPATKATESSSNDLMAMLDALEQEEEEEEREKQQQLMEQQLTFDIDGMDGQKDMTDFDEEDLDDLYDTEVADNMFDHFEDDEEYATQGVVEQEDATTHEEEEQQQEEVEEEPIKDVVAERPEQITPVAPPQPAPAPAPAATVASVVEHSESLPSPPPKEKKLSKFKQLQLEKQQQEQQQQSDDQPKKPTNTMPKFKVQKPTERKRKQQSPPTIESSSASSSKVETSTTPPPVISSENQQQQQSSPPSPPSPPKKKVSKFKQFQDQQRQGSTNNNNNNSSSSATSTTKLSPPSSKGTPIAVPSKHTPTSTKKEDTHVAPISTTTATKKKVSFGTTTSVREHDRLASPQAGPQGVYNEPLNDDTSNSKSTLQHTIRSPSDIFRVVKQHQPTPILEEDGYPVIQQDDDDDNNANDTATMVDLRDLATSLGEGKEPMFRPNYDVDEDQLPTLHPWRKPYGTTTAGDALGIAKKSKLDTTTMRGAVLEREAEALDLDQVEDDMDFKEIKSSYQRQRQNMLATMGGLSFDAKPEFEVFDEELPLPSNEKKKKDEEDVVVVDLPKKMSRFKAARMGLAPATEQ